MPEPLPEPSTKPPPEPASPSRPIPRPRADFPVFVPITTRWADNDAYGHLNNVVYYSLFDSAVNGWLVRQGVLDIQHGAVIGLVVETRCHYFAPLAFPAPVEAGLRVAELGRSSARYEVGIFAEGAAETAAHGHFVHVYVDRATRRPLSLPDPLRRVLETLRSPR